MTRRLGWTDYLAHQVKAGVFAEDAPCPENDPRVWREFLSLVRAENPQEPEAEIAVLAGRYGFYLDAADTGRDGENVAGSTSLIDICNGVSYVDFINDLSTIREQANKMVLTDTFSFKDGYGAGGETHDGLVWLNSPVAAIAQPFETYLESLTTERRKKYRRSAADFEKTNLRFEISAHGVTAKEIDFTRANLQKKWGDDADYALRQTLWAMAVQAVRPAQSLIMRVMDGDRLAFLQTMIVKGRSVYCQSITKDEDNFYNGLAAFTDFECIKALCDRPEYEIFDASCRTSLEDTESIGIAKRATVNRNCVKPLLAFGALSEEIAAMVASGAVQGKEA